MSHILDALQKVQDEKAAKLKQSAITAGVLLDAPTVRKPAKNRFLLVGGVIILLLAGTLLAGLFFKPSPASRINTVAAVPPSAQTVPTQPPGPPVQAPQPATPPQQLPVAAPPVPAPLAAPAPVPAVPQTIAQQQNHDDNEEKTSSRRKSQRSVPTAPLQTVADTAAATVLYAAPEGVKLTGIAWQDSRKMRRAVVNDILSGEGTIVAGAKIIEIKPTVVRFEKNGTLYEVSLSR